ncbi:MAG: hypothetical protein J5I81_03800 [Nitrococcus mobilis]|nr:hypothetical protein [Nitrococcus mobilis]
MAEAPDPDSLERLELLSGQIQRAKDQHRFGDALDAAVRAVDDAESVISQFEKLAGFSGLVNGFLDPSDRQHCLVLLTRVRTLGQQLPQVSDTATLQDGTTKVSQLPSQVEQADAIINRGWKAKIDQAFAATGELGGVLREIPETRQLGSEMEAIALQAGQLKTDLEDAERSIARFKALVAEREGTTDSLTNLGAGKEVVDFLFAVANQSATLETVTAEVRSWLDERNALARFKVGL